MWFGGLIIDGARTCKNIKVSYCRFSVVPHIHMSVVLCGRTSETVSLGRGDGLGDRQMLRSTRRMPGSPERELDLLAESSQHGVRVCHQYCTCPLSEMYTGKSCGECGGRESSRTGTESSSKVSAQPYAIDRRTAKHLERKKIASAMRVFRTRVFRVPHTFDARRTKVRRDRQRDFRNVTSYMCKGVPCSPNVSFANSIG